MCEKIIKSRAKRSIIWKMSHNQLEKLVEQSNTFANILKVFGLEDKGGNIHTLKRRLDEEQIDYSHIPQGLNANKGRKFEVKHLDFNELFKENSIHKRSSAKHYIIKYNLIPYECALCGNKGIWNNKELVLVLDHINGIPNDHRLENLRFLCPNCNAQQDTFAGKNIKKNRRHKFYCQDCGKEISFHSTRCKSCATKLNVVDKCKRPSKEQLIADIETLNNIKIGMKYNVSEAAVRKWRKLYGI